MLTAQKAGDIISLVLRKGIICLDIKHNRVRLSGGKRA